MAVGNEGTTRLRARAGYAVRLLYWRDRFLFLGLAFMGTWALLANDRTSTWAWVHRGSVLFVVGLTLLFTWVQLAAQRLRRRRLSIAIDGDLRLEPARRRDVRAVRTCFDDVAVDSMGWRPADVANHLITVGVGTSDDLHVIRLAGAVAGVVWFDRATRSGTLGLILAPSHRRTGLSRRVLSLAADHLTESGIVPEAMTGRPELVRVLQSIGFTIEGQLKHDLPNGRIVEATLLRRRIGDPSNDASTPPESST